MIEWLAFDELRDLFRSYPPIGVMPRGFFSAIVDDDPKELIRRTYPRVVEGALFGGRVNTIPFLFRTEAPQSWFGGGFGCDVLFPLRADNDLASLHALARLPLPRPRPTELRFTPLCGGPFGVALVGSREPIYVPRTRDEAVAAARLLNGWNPGTFTVIPAPITPAPWLVVGPRSGPYVSQVTTAENEQEAHSIADRQSRDGLAFTVARSLPEWLSRTQ